MRICVKNLPEKITETEIIELFSHIGNITDVYMLKNGKNQFRRVAFIGYRSEEDAKKSQEYFDKTLVFNHKISVELAEEEKKNSIGSVSESVERKIVYSKTIFIRNIVKEVECEEIKKVAEKYGQITEISIVRDSEGDGSIKETIVKYKEGMSALRAFKELKIICGMRVRVCGRSLKNNDEEMNKSHYNSLFFDFESITKKACETGRVSKKELIDVHDDKLGAKISVIETDMIKRTKIFLESKGIFIDQMSGKKNNKRLILRNADIFSVLELVKGKYKVSVAPSKCLCLLDFDDEKEAIEACKILNLKRFKNKIIYCEFAPLCEKAVTRISNNDNNSVQRIKSSEKAETGISNNDNIKSKKKVKLIVSDKSCVHEKDESANQSVEQSFNQSVKQDEEKLLMSKDKLNLDSQVISLRPKITSKQIAKKCHKVIIKNVPFQACEEDLREIFTSFTEIVEVRLPLKNESSHRGFGFLILNSEKSVNKVLEHFGTGTHLYGRRLVLEKARS